MLKLDCPLIVAGMCTAMRRGDCCTLLRDSVDLKGGLVTVKRWKTGETVQIPIFPLLRRGLEKAMAKPPERLRLPYCVFPALEVTFVGPREIRTVNSIYQLDPAINADTQKVPAPPQS